MQAIAGDLVELGHTIASTWILGEHQTKDAEPTFEEAQAWCNFDIKDLERADTVIAFTEPKGTMSRGGRHTEFGYALCWAQAGQAPPSGKPYTIHVVGHREHIFYCAPEIIFWSSWEALREHLIREALRGPKAHATETTEGQNRDIIDLGKSADQQQRGTPESTLPSGV